MASPFEWVTEQGGFACSLNDPPSTIVDNIRVLIGDKGPTPIAYLSDGQIQSIATMHDDDLYTSAAECAEACATQCMQLWQEVQQGTRFRLKQFDLQKAFENFMELADMLRNRSTQGALPSYGMLSGQICTPEPASVFVPGYRRSC